MRNSKRYTNLTFTKRVDHENGYISKKHQKEPAICPDCQAIYYKGHWSFDKNALMDDPFGKIEMNQRICPACLKIKNSQPAGFVYLDGSFLLKHLVEIENLLRNEEEKMLVNNPLARIMEWQRNKDSLIISTTTENLAKHLGRALLKAFSGDVRYVFSHENKITRVYWQRNN